MNRVASALLALLLGAASSCDDDPAEPDGGGDADLDASDADAAFDGDPAPCPDEMVLVDDGDEPAFCIDRYEHPGLEGIFPTTGLAWFEANETCTGEGKVVCTERQWLIACEGTPVEACLGEPALSGLREGCVSAVGVHDLAGNVAEWTATPGGSVTFWVRGGSGEDESIGCDVSLELDAEQRRTDLGVRCCRRPRR